MNITYCSGDALSSHQRETLWILLKQADREFVPPLSARETSTQQHLAESTPAPQTDHASAEPTLYFQAMMQQHFLLAEENGCLLGFLSCIPAYTLMLPCKEARLCTYVSTIIVDSAHRGKGIARMLYRHLFSITENPIVTRTWSSNHAHIGLLGTLGFELIATLPNDRGAGIDTVYYQKDVRQEE